MNDDISDEDFLKCVLDVGARIAPHLRAEPLSREEIQELDKQVEAHRPFLRKCTVGVLASSVLRGLDKWPSGAHDVHHDLVRMNCALEDDCKRTLYLLIFLTKERGGITHELKAVGERLVHVCSLTREGRIELQRQAARFPDVAKYLESYETHRQLGLSSRCWLRRQADP
jgi:hypothetical protein